jgi:simple sugar transport system ATP-binding protein
VLGIAGVDGNGQVELVEAITGLRHVTSGRILLDGKEIQNQKPRAIREAGVAHIPSDRNAMGIAQQAQVWENLAAVEYYAPPYSGKMALSLSKIMADAKDLILRFGVQTPGLKSATGNLSGGNIQRLIVARELGTEKAQVVVAAQPTRGIDIAGTEAIREMLLDYTRRDAGVLLISADLDEILALCDRVTVMYEGCLTDAGKVDDGIRQRIGQLMTGGSIDDRITE